MVAIKKCLIKDNTGKNPVTEEDYKRELNLMSNLNHPFIIHNYGYNIHIRDDGEKEISFIMERARGSLEDLIGKAVPSGTKKEPFNQKKLLDIKVDYKLRKLYITQICFALCYLHDNHVIHGDLKLDNILIGEDNNCRVADFGTSRVIKGGMLSYCFPIVIAYTIICFMSTFHNWVLYSLLLDDTKLLTVSRAGKFGNRAQ